MAYFVIYQHEKEATVIRYNSRKDLLEDIEVNDWGKKGEDKYDDYSFLSEVPDMDPGYWGGNILVIKGEIVVPKTKRLKKL